MRVNILLINNFAWRSTLGGPILNFKALTNTEDGLSVTVSEASTSIVQFSFNDIFRDHEYVKSSNKTKKVSQDKTESDTDSKNECQSKKDFTNRLKNITSKLPDTDNSVEDIPSTFWKYDNHTVIPGNGHLC